MKLWLRHLSCGHKRPTNIAYLCGDYTKPIIGKCAFCRECMEDVKIIEVEEESEEK